jgi:hypothetical protein
MPIPQFTAGQVLTAAELNAMVDAINAGGAVKVERFTASGTWTVPAGVTYAVAHILGGGGGAGSGSSGAGGTSSVAFAGGTISAAGGPALNTTNTLSAVTVAGPANSGRGAYYIAASSGSFYAYAGNPQIGDGVKTVAGGAVTPAASITITIGAGGAAGTSGAAGGSGFIYIEYQGG